MATRVSNTESTATPPARRPASSSNMDLLGSAPSSTSPRAANAPLSSPATTRASSTRETVPSAVRSPAKSSISAPSRLPASSAPSRNVAAASPAPTSPLAQSAPPRQAEPVPPSNQPQNPPVPLGTTSPLPAPSASQAACRVGSDCLSRVCIAGVCQTSSGFALSVSTASTLRALSGSGTLVGGYKSKYGTPTACSDPRCTLPAAITSLNGAEEKDISASLGSHERAVSSAATAGIVLAFLFATLAVLLVVPKIRDWAKRCFGCTKEESGIVVDDGSPEFGNHHASAFINEKRQTLATETNTSYAGRAGSRNGQQHTQDPSGEYDDHLPGYEGGQGDIADIKMDLRQEEYYEHYNDNAYSQQQSHTHAPPVARPTIEYDRSHTARDLASYVEHNPPPPLPASRSAPMQLSRATPAPAQYVPPVSKPANITAWSSNARQAPRETVLPYTVEEDRDVLMGLRALGTPAVNESASNQQFNSTRDAYTTPVMRNNGFDHSRVSPQTPITPGSAYSVHTTLLPASLRPGYGQGSRAPILKQGLMGSRPSFKRLSNALRFDSNTKSS
ncbi:hypothetical protein P389DRAFT_210233 [Cystobasidium minutum MCA 4210]|uniref:uncharacterized protein n=1 Tax=Cystobasidium minutum MCA 4210 TaxID=1397322 RepID=UPI0034CD0B29|eukprot:jgi/Rhomi1/210233/estExt_Genemark1.C_3_t20467